MERYDVIIIGAGICGLSAALRLQEKHEGLRVLLVEGESEPGGRARTIWLSDGQRADPGGSWIHGGKETPFYSWLHKRYSDLRFHGDALRHFTEVTANGTVISDPGQHAMKHFSHAYEHYKKSHPDRDVTLADLVPLLDYEDAADYANAMARGWMAVDSPDQVSGDEMFGDTYDYSGLQIEGGIARAVRRMAFDVRRHAVIALGRDVARVGQDDDGAMITLEDGTEFSTTTALITVSAGVLQSGAIAFAGGLPNAVATYLTNVQMGHTVKIFVPLREEFFMERDIKPDSYINFIGARPHVFCYARPNGQPYAVFFCGGQEMEELEALPASDLFAHLNKTAGLHPDWLDLEKYAVAPPTVTQWSSSLRFRGSYTAMMPGGKRQDPMRAGHLYFAGEAFLTRDEHGKESSSTMSGAWSSGRVAADLILSNLRAKGT